MNDLSLADRISRIEDELAGLDSALDARTRLLWQELSAIKRMVAELRDQYARTRTRAEVSSSCQ